jgi:hypothetical protein
VHGFGRELQQCMVHDNGSACHQWATKVPKFGIMLLLFKIGLGLWTFDGLVSIIRAASVCDTILG